MKPISCAISARIHELSGLDCRISGALWRCLGAAADNGVNSQLLQLAEQGREKVLLSGLPPLLEFEREFDARFGELVINPAAAGETPPGKQVWQLLREDMIVDESALRLLRSLQAAVMRHYQD